VLYNINIIIKSSSSSVIIIVIIGEEGKPLKRKCLGCTLEVILGPRSSYYLDAPGLNNSELYRHVASGLQKPHNECFAKVEKWIHDKKHPAR
jgi:hypothetical protein